MRGPAGQGYLNMAVSPDARRAVVVSALLLALVAPVSGSFFRYGTLSWRALDGYDINSKRIVQFSLSLAVRADYKWGEFEGHQWALAPRGSSDYNSFSWYGSEGFYKDETIAPGWVPASCTEEQRNNFYQQRECFECGPDSSPEADNYSGCVKTDAMASISSTRSFYVKFGVTKQSNGANVVPCEHAFVCDISLTRVDDDGTVLEYTASDNSKQNADCFYWYENPLFNPDLCAPWDEMFGFFFGDGDTHNVVMELFPGSSYTEAELGSPRYQAVGNYMVGTSRFLHSYIEDTTDQFLAYFTGGDRSLECARLGQGDTHTPDGTECLAGDYGKLLNNNAEGRFRLETQVWIKGGITASPVIVMPPIIPVPHRPYGERSRFHVAAYDPLGNALDFRFGTPKEMGGIVRSKSDAFPYSEGLIMANNHNSTMYDPNTGKLLYNFYPFNVSIGTQYGTFYCNKYTKAYVLGGGFSNAACQEDRQPMLPPGVTQHSFTSTIPGMVEWNTWLDADGEPCTAQTASGCAGKLDNGLYNFVVVASQFTGANGNGVKVTADFLVYLYDGPTYFCNKNCMDNKRVNPFGLTTTNDASDNYDASGDYSPQYPGVPTYVDRDGIYGTDCLPGDDTCTIGTRVQSQSCTICGRTAPERNLCTPFADDGQGNEDACGVGTLNSTSGVVSIVPAFTACKMNQVPQFVQVEGVLPYNGGASPRFILENPGQELYDASLGLKNAVRPVFRAYRYDDVIFAVTAVDHDDCSELSVEATALPGSAIFEEPTYLANYAAFPEGRMVRRVFRWNGDNLRAQDERPESSMVCFYASDKYLVTSQPFYCVEILIEEQPSAMEQTLIRFDCKLSLEWNALVRRFVVTDAPYGGPIRKYYTKCEFEDYMWHHAMVSVDEIGEASLYVDGEAQEMVTGVGFDPRIVLQFGRGADVPGETSFTLSAYPNMCPTDYSFPPPPPSAGTRRRGLLADLGPDNDATTANVAGGLRESMFGGSYNENPTSDQPVRDGYNNITAPAGDDILNSTVHDCCSFAIADGCTAGKVASFGEGSRSATFEGLSDEVAVWNRALSWEEVRATLFKMPQYFPTHKLEAPRGVQEDLAAGRVLYARFNNPCMEGDLASTPVTTARRRSRRSLLQTAVVSEDYVQTTGMASAAFIGGVSFNEPRREGISDEGGFTAGDYVTLDGRLSMRDWDNDTLLLVGWREHALFAYTGVPWAAPAVHRVVPGGAVPLDGGVEVEMKGIGFARSPFLKCATVAPDIRGEWAAGGFGPEDATRARVDDPPYANRFLNLNASFLTGANPWLYESFSSVALSRGRVKLSPDDEAPELHPSSFRFGANKVYNPSCPDNPCLGGEKSPRVQCKDPGNCPELDPEDAQVESRCVRCSVGTRIDWLSTNPGNRKGRLHPYERISPLPSFLGDNYAVDYYYGGWETVTCEAPPGPFPSDLYYVGVSNDAGLTGSPPKALTYSEYALKMNNTGRVVTPEVVGKSFSAWFLITDEAPPCNDDSAQACRTTIFRLSNGVGVAMDYGIVRAMANMKTIGDGAGEQFLGSLGTNLTALNEWHHAMLTIDNSTVRFYLDGVDVIEEEIEVPAPADGYRLLSFADRLVGYVDEVKVFKDVLSYEQAMESMWRREPAASDRLEAYYRLNSWDDPLMDYVGDNDAVCSDGGSCTLDDIAAPWEPTTMYSINGGSPELVSLSLTGGETLDITGFNFAPSQWLGCYWGEYERVVGVGIAPPEIEPLTCPPLPDVSAMWRPDSEGKMPRPDGLPQSMVPYDLMAPVANASAVFTSESGFVTPESSRDMRCVSPPRERAGLYHFAAANREALVTTVSEFAEVALECDGVDDYATAPDAALLMTPAGASGLSSGYTLSTWVLPYGTLADSDLPMFDTGLPGQFYTPHVPGDSSLTGPIRRANDEDEDTDSQDPTVVAAFESPTPGGGPGQRTTYGALLWTPGRGFAYYDDCIADVASSAPNYVPNTWHHVAVSVDPEGQGVLYVDGAAADNFTTNCRVPMDASFSMCASVAENPAADGNLTTGSLAVFPNAHFAGRLDQLELHASPLNSSDIAAGMFQYDPVRTPAVKYHFARIAPGGVFPNVAENSTMGDATPGASDGPVLVKSTGPWAAAKVMGASEGEVDVGGGQAVTVMGHNFAPSQWLKLDLGYGDSVPFTYGTANMMTASTPAGVCHDEAEVVVTNADGRPEGDGDSAAELNYECTVAGLLEGVVAYYAMDGQDSLVDTGSGMSTLVDAGRMAAHGSCPSSLRAADRNGYLHAAFGTLDTALMHNCSVPAPVTSTLASAAAAGEWTVSAWLFLPYPVDASPSPELTAYGSWKLVTYVVGHGDAPIVYSGHQNATELDAPIFAEVILDFVVTGVMAPGIWDDVWLYSRALAPCEVAGRYFTSSYALDFSGEAAANSTVAGGSVGATVLPWGIGAVSAWVFSYSAGEPQTIVSADDGSFLLGLEHGRVSVSVSPSSRGPCLCEPCENEVNYISWKARVMPGQWHHIAVSYNGFDAFILVDGVLRDKVIIRERCFEVNMQGGRRRLASFDGEVDSVEGLEAAAKVEVALGRRKLAGVVGYGLEADDCTRDPDANPDAPICLFSSAEAEEEVEPECRPWMLDPRPFRVGTHADHDLNHPYLPPNNRRRPFNGLIYDLRSFDQAAEPWEVKALAQCAPKDALLNGRGDAYLRFDGGGIAGAAVAHTALAKDITVTGIMPSMYANASYDGPTHGPACTLYGPGVTGTVNGLPGVLTLTARTVCGEKRAIGGDDFSAALMDGSEFALDDGFVSVTDANDGTYVVSYDRLPTCGLWNMTVALDEAEIMRFEVDIVPGATNATRSEVVVPPDGDFGFTSNSLSTIFIQARDFNGCPQRVGGDDFKVTLRGPADINATVEYIGDGLYAAHFIAPVAGTYFVEACLVGPNGEEVIVNGHFCLTVAGTGSMLFRGEGSVEVTEPAVDDGYNLDGAGLLGFTMEAWVRSDGPPPEDQAAMIIAKGTFNESINADYIKGYFLRYSDDYTRLIAGVYTGRGDLRTVEAPNEVASNVWFHLAAVYNASSLTIYRNGGQIGRSVFDDERPMHSNDYHHPVSVGAGFFGSIDEVKLWDHARTVTDITNGYFCPPKPEMDGLLLYLPFNTWYDFGTKTQGYSATCNPGNPEAIASTCLQAAVYESRRGGNSTVVGAEYDPDTPMVLDGVGFISRTYSFVDSIADMISTDAMETLLLVHARDRCDWPYITGSDGLFQVGLQKYVWNYISPDPPGIPYPRRDTQGAEQTAVTTVVPDTCADPTSPTLPYHKGDVHNQAYPFTQAGEYLVRESVRLSTVQGGGRLVQFDRTGPIPVSVEAGEPVRMELEGLDRTFVAGQPATVYATAYDDFNNILMEPFPFNVDITMVGEPWTLSLNATVSFHALTGRYSIVFTAPHSPAAGAYSLLISAAQPGITLTTTPPIPSFRPQPSPWREVLVDGAVPPASTHRFEHSAVMYEGDMYVFGGALFDKTYLNDLLVLQGADGHTHRDAFAYQKSILLNSSSPYPGAPVVQVTVDTAELIAAGRLHERCVDILFKGPNNGEPLEFYVDSHPGCNTAETLIFVKLPNGTLATGEPVTITMAYGNAYVVENAYSDPHSLFEFYDGFEGETLNPAWTAIESCTMAPLPEPVHTLNTTYSYRGSGSLYVPVGQRGGLLAPLPAPLDRFHLKAYFWDSDHVLSAHFISPDLDACGATANSHTTYPRPNNLQARVTAVGTYTMSSRLKYCVGAPWQSAPDVAPVRAAQWRRLEVTSAPEAGLTVYIDGVVVKTAPAINASRVLIAAGLSLDIPVGANLVGAHAHWDEVLLSTWYPEVQASVGGLDDDVMVDVVESRRWFEVEGGQQGGPPPRYSHSAVVSGGTMWVFGGERASYAFNDLWSFEFETSTWRYITPRGAAPPSARYEHSAVVVTKPGGAECMQVQGGRNGHRFLSDVWEFCFDAMEWTLLAEDTPAGARFGHSAAAVPGTSHVYLFGGYTDTGFSAEFFHCEGGQCADVTWGCPESPSVGATVADAGLTPRYGHSMYATPDARALLLYGGSNLQSKDGLPGVFRFDVDACNWERLTVDGPDPSRYEHALGWTAGGLIAHGGHSAGSYLNQLSFLPAT